MSQCVANMNSGVCHSCKGMDRRSSEIVLDTERLGVGVNYSLLSANRNPTSD